ncbi:MAG: methyltransferase domain-containing protein [Streptosporangiaceae bacterium]|jgi:SAM-dependent methyltransferase
MKGNVGDPMSAEFGTVAEWTAHVARDLGPEYHIPAACRGSGQPAALDWLLAGLRPRPGDVLADAGAGTGGPAAYAAGHTGVRPVLAEPEHGACRAAAALFHLPVVEADATALPLGDASADVAWCLGVLCTAEGPDAQVAILRELRRIVRPARRIGLLVYLATTGQLDDPPQGNHFPACGQLTALLGGAHLEVLAVADASGLPRPSPVWRDRTAAVERELQRRFGNTAQLAAATEQSRRIARLLKSGQLTAQVLVVRGR